MNVLLTNDDGIHSEGLKVLAEALKELGDIFIVAPDRQRSAVGLSITLERPLRVQRLAERTFSVDGMPADCVELGIHKLMDSPPDLIVSGINNGQNLGYDIYHSGTVGAAVAGTMFGVPSMAVSIATDHMVGDNKVEIHYETAAQIALMLAGFLIERKLPMRTLLNVNVPNLILADINGIEITRHCDATYDIEIECRQDPRGKEYFWIGGVFQRDDNNIKTDQDALNHGRVSITPLRLDLTDYSVMQELTNWINDAVI